MRAVVWAATGMTHASSASHHSTVEWVVVAAAALVLLAALGLAIRYTVSPGETHASHIKRRILLDELDETNEAGQP